ncbi:amidase family protein [Heyndrickxia acidicola]|uniref:Amidase family protein n=1 Tax=Heyndrickxia acidicola TaxID=209389 RepID=A0ABU6MAR6_9BACI|nr:amidase family protein [Heyndrickxia acidicola]MED1201758.1 amidase family protein [Heyndrickxia acidicola]
MVKEAADVLSDYGAEAVEFKVPELKNIIKDFYQIMSTDGGNGLKKTIGNQEQVFQIQNILRFQTMNKLQRFLFSCMLRLLSQKTVGEVIIPHAGRISDNQFKNLILKRAEVREAFLERLDKGQIDILICPPFICPALQHDLSVQLSYEGAYGAVFNYLNMPAGVVSLGSVKASDIKKRLESKNRVIQTLEKIEKGSIGLPIGVQVAGKLFCEDKVLAVMKVLEEQFKKLEDYPAGKLCK